MGAGHGFLGGGSSVAVLLVESGDEDVPWHPADMLVSTRAARSSFNVSAQ